MKLKSTEEHKIELQSKLDSKNAELSALDDLIVTQKELLSEQENKITKLNESAKFTSEEVLKMRDNLKLVVEEVEDLKKSQNENAMLLNDKNSQITKLTQEINEYQEKIDENEKTFIANIEETKERIIDQERENALDSEGELVEMYLKREETLKKKLKEAQLQAQREVRLYEKKFLLYKNMYNKIKNEKLDVLQYGSNTGSDNKVLFISQGSTRGLDESVISEVAPCKTDAISEFEAKQEVGNLVEQLSSDEKTQKQLEIDQENLQLLLKSREENEALKKELEKMKALNNEVETLKEENRQLSTDNDELSKNVQEMKQQILQKDLEGRENNDELLISEIDKLRLELETERVKSKSCEEEYNGIRDRMREMNSQFTMEMLAAEEKVESERNM